MKRLSIIAIFVLCLSLLPACNTTTAKDFQVYIHPDGNLYVGDKISIEVAAPPSLFDTEDGLQKYSIKVIVGNEQIGVSHFEYYFMDVRATLAFAWDTKDLEPGLYELTILIKPFDITIKKQVELLPQSELPQSEVEAKLKFVKTDCCTIYYINGTDAERDLDMLTQMIQGEFLETEAQFQETYPEKLTIFLYPRQIGQGGFSGIFLSYNDDGYLPGEFELALHHEISHMVDAAHCPYYRPMMLVEGLMLYTSGGHFRAGPSMPRAAALLDMGDYIPLKKMAGANFYELHHEYSYLEASALVEYLIGTYGWEEFDRFYCDIMSPGPYTSARETFELALSQHFGITLSQLEDGFIAELKTYAVTDDLRDDVQLTAYFLETIRRYQENYDPATYMYSFWLPPVDEINRYGVVADYLRQPEEPNNLQITALLIQARQQWEISDFNQLEQTLDNANAIMDNAGK